MTISLFLQIAADNAANVATTPPGGLVDNILALWPIWSVLAAAVAGILGLRLYEKAGIHKTNAANIEALDKLLATKQKELDEARSDIEERDAAIEDLQGQKNILESEYKTLAGLVLSELLSWVSRYESHRAELAQKDSDLRVANARIAILETREAEHSAIHRSQ